MDSLPENVVRRLRAAELSGGISSDSIYNTIENIISGRGLGGAVLDYGAGIGELTQRLSQSGSFTRVVGADILDAPSNFATRTEWIQQDLNEPVSNHEGEFDVVVAAEVIEHLENPRFMIRELYRLLRPGGTAIVSTPNNESWRSILALIARGHFVAFAESCYPAHITALLRIDLTRILLEAKFHKPQFYFTNFGGIPKKPHITWQQISMGLLRGVRFSDNLIAVARKPV